MNKLSKKIAAVLAGSVLSVACFAATPTDFAPVETAITASAASITIDDMPSDYQYAADWIWNNRISVEDSTGSASKRYNVLFDQIIAGQGTLNYVVRWQSYKQLTLAQREGFEKLVEDGINDWTDYLVGYENWPYEHVDVNIVGWAVLDASCIVDPQPDEVIWDNLITDYDSTYDTSNGVEEIPDKLPSAPEELWSFNYFTDRSHVYPGTRFDMYLWCTQGFPSIGGCGGDWGQRLSDDAYINIAESGSNMHVHVHEVGHGFGMTDFYGGEGESNGFPPGGFPGNGTSIMMAGSSSEITDFDGWMMRYMWTKLSAEEGRFDLENAQPEVTEPTTEPTVTTTTTTVTTTSTEMATTTQQVVYAEPAGYIELNNIPTKVEYTVGEELDLTGLEVSLKFAQGGEITQSQLNKFNTIYDKVNPLDYPDIFTVDTSAYDNTKTGDYEIKVSCTTDASYSYWILPSNTLTFNVSVYGSVMPTQETVTFEDTITSIGDGTITFANNGTFEFDDTHYGDDPQKNLNHYEIGDKIKISMTIMSQPQYILTVNSIEIITDVTPEIIMGDVDKNGAFELADIIMLNKYLTRAGDITDSTAADMNSDGKINVFDFIIIKESYLSR